VLDEPPEPADPTVVLDEPPVLDEVLVPGELAVLGEAPDPVDEPPPQAPTSSTMPAVTARTPARRGCACHRRQRPPVVSFTVASSWSAE
jgi:hypothetical protein